MSGHDQSRAATGQCPATRFYAADDLPALDFDPFFGELLRGERVARIRMPHGEGEAWLVTRYEDVRFVTSDPRFSRAGIVGRPIPKMTGHIVPLDRAISFADPPEQARARGVVAGWFTQRAVDRLRPHAQQILDRLLDAMAEDGAPADFIQYVTSPFPLEVISELLGVPEKDRARARDWAQTMLTRVRDEAAAERVRQTKEASTAYFRAQIERRRAEPREDLLSVMATAEGEGRLDEAETLALTSLIQFNGWHAVRNNISNMIYVLLTRPELAARLRAEPDVVGRAVEELLRFIPHKHGLGQPRIATEDVEVGGVLIRAGDCVYNSYVAANWDERVYPDPDRVDVDREGPPHLAFGFGPHVCVGPLLARMEAEVLLSTVVTRLPELELAVPAEQVKWQTDVLIRGPETLPVRW
ncbi:cytochrome P450 [Streptomyces palmae]|uniref:Cytochrome P450 n=1 Tax=Streptomyces palmae TaxID=1701085 RepID=A0A4Z0HBB9_9ACTN|nr:cytochrome P450 [Streptomyces palmae]TGB08954.1 cytochrome P450 [Streptomyces palmae]